MCVCAPSRADRFPSLVTHTVVSPDGRESRILKKRLNEVGAACLMTSIRALSVCRLLLLLKKKKKEYEDEEDQLFFFIHC